MLDDRVATPVDFAKTVTTAGTPVTLRSVETEVRSALIRAKSTNTGVVALGSATVRAAGTPSGAYLNPGDAVVVGRVNLASWYLDSAVNGDGVLVTAEGL